MNIRSLNVYGKNIIIRIFVCVGFCIGWAECRTFASGITINSTGPVLNANTVNDAEILPMSNRIIGGQESAPHSHPYIVRIQWKDDKGTLSNCGGFILADEWVISAAHCIDKAVSMEVSAGKHDVSKTEQTEQIVDATHTWSGMYKPYKTHENDIGFIKVKPTFKFNEYVQPAVLTPADWDKMGLATVAGWGFENSSVSAGPTGGKELREVEVPIISNTKCKKLYQGKSIFETSLCAGYDEGTKDSCQGDSGGPLFVKENGQEIVIGIVSWGAGCAQPNKPGVYTRLSKYLDVITKVTGWIAPPSTSDNRLSLSTAMADTLCKQYRTFVKEDCITLPVMDRPPGRIKCGWFDWKDKACSVKYCHPFIFSKCW